MGAFFIGDGEMWSPDNAEPLKHVASTFLISSWHELFYAYTPDSNQPRLHNVPSLIEELASVSERCQRESRLQSHVTKIKEELKYALKDEEQILVNIPEYQSRAMSLLDKQSIIGLTTGSRLLVEQQEKYNEVFFESASKTIDELPKKKKVAHKCIRRVATLAFQHGKEEHDVWAPLNKDPSRQVGEVFEDIVNLTIAGTSNYVCTLALVGHVSGIHAALRREGILPVAQAKLPTSYLKEITEPGEQLLFIRFEVEAESIRNALAQSRKRLGLATGLVSLYQSATVQVHPMALIQVNGKDIIFSQPAQAFRRLHPRSRADRDIREALDMLKPNQVDERLLGAIELLSLTSSSTDSRVRLINSWSSIETLAGGHEGDTTLERVSSLIVPLVISRHVGRTSRYLAIATQQQGMRTGRSDFGAGFPCSRSKFVAPDEMLRTLTAPKNSAPICDLLKFAEHPLLRYRIYRSWGAFHDPMKLWTILDSSKRFLEWHLARIYRERNSLVHQGIESPYLVPLLDNLQNYISMAVQRLIHELKNHPSWDVRHGMEYWKGKMQHILNSLKANPRVLTTEDFIDGSKPERLWPA